MRKLLYMGIFLSLTLTLPFSLTQAEGLKNDIPKVPTPDMVTLLDLGAHKCVPCKMMEPVIAELQKEYKGRASVIFIDVWKNPAEAKRYGIQSIPTQIFYDKSGAEVTRHVGYLDKKSIVDVFEKLGVPKEISQ